MKQILIFEFLSGSNASVNYLVANEIPLAVIRPLNHQELNIQNNISSPIYSNLPNNQTFSTRDEFHQTTTTNSIAVPQVATTNSINTNELPQNIPASATRKLYTSSSDESAIRTIQQEPGTQQPQPQVLLNKSYSQDQINLIVGDLDLDPVTVRENHLIDTSDNRVGVVDDIVTINSNNKCDDSDLTIHEKENNLLSASRLRLLQDTTMIESALDLDSLDDSSIGNNSQAGLLKIGIV